MLASRAIAAWLCDPGSLPKGSIVVPFGGSYLESDKVTPKRNYYGTMEPTGKSHPTPDMGAGLVHAPTLLIN